MHHCPCNSPTVSYYGIIIGHKFQFQFSLSLSLTQAIYSSPVLRMAPSWFGLWAPRRRCGAPVFIWVIMASAPSLSPSLIWSLSPKEPPSSPLWVSYNLHQSNHVTSNVVFLNVFWASVLYSFFFPIWVKTDILYEWHCIHRMSLTGKRNNA